MGKQNFRVLLAECFGTFILAFAILVSISNPGFPVSTPVVAALTLGLLVYALGPLSGGHFNPAVTVGALAIGQISRCRAGGYILSQVVGALLAKLMASWFLDTSVAWLEPDGSLFTAVGEAVGAILFTFAIASVMLGKVSNQFSGVVIGVGLLLGISMAAPNAYGILNPAVALGLGAFAFTPSSVIFPSALAYILGPMVGAFVGMYFCHCLYRQ